MLHKIKLLLFSFVFTTNTRLFCPTPLANIMPEGQICVLDVSFARDEFSRGRALTGFLLHCSRNNYGSVLLNNSRVSERSTDCYTFEFVLELFNDLRGQDEGVFIKAITKVYFLVFAPHLLRYEMIDGFRKAIVSQCSVEELRLIINICTRVGDLGSDVRLSTCRTTSDVLRLVAQLGSATNLKPKFPAFSTAWGGCWESPDDRYHGRFKYLLACAATALSDHPRSEEDSRGTSPMDRAPVISQACSENGGHGSLPIRRGPFSDAANSEETLHAEVGRVMLSGSAPEPGLTVRPGSRARAGRANSQPAGGSHPSAAGGPISPPVMTTT